MTSDEKKQIIDFGRETADDTIQITIKVSDHPQSAKIEEFGKKLGQLLPSAKMSFDRADEKNDLPSVVVGNSLFYHAIPLEKELEPFLEALKMSADLFRAGYPAFKTPEEIDTAALFDIFIAPQCPYCPSTVKTFIKLCFSHPLIRVSVIDASMFHEMAAQRGVRSVPTTFLDNSFCWTGNVNPDEIIRIVKNRDPEELSTESLKKMIHEGLASKVAEMMIQKKTIFPNFIELLCDAKWTVRLGAMVTVEEMAVQNIHVAAQVEKPLWERFFELENSVKGDILYVLGETGHRKTLENIEKASRGSLSEDVQEAAKEAIQTIRQRLSSM